MTWLWIAGLWVSFLFGWLACAIFAAGSDADDRAERTHYDN